MPEYRLYLFDRAHIRRADSLTASDDGDAIAKAEQMVDGKTAELWRGARKVRTFNS